MEHHRESSSPEQATRSSTFTAIQSDPFRVLQVCFFMSGFSSLIYEIGWLGRLQVLIGATVLGLALTVSAYLLGLATGSAIAAKVAPRSKHPLGWYLLCEGIVAVWGLLFSTLVNQFEGQTTLGALLLIFVPTVFLGGTLPFLLAWTNARARLAPLYGVNAAGAAFGALGAGLFVLPTFGFSNAMVLAAVINGCIIALASQLKPPSQHDLLSRVRGAAHQRKAVVSTLKKLNQRTCLIALFGSGVLAFCTQLLWNRLGALMIGPSVYVFPLVATVVLAGISVGSYLQPRLLALSWSLLSVALAGSLLWSFALLSYGSVALFWFHGFWPLRTNAAPFLMKAFFELILFMVSCGPAAVLCGAMFPLLADCLSECRKDKSGSESTGIAAAFSMGGGLLGSLLLSLVILPRWGVSTTSFLVYALSLLPAVISAARAIAKVRNFQALLPAAMVAALAILVPHFIFPMDHLLLTSGAFYNRHGHLGQPGVGYTSAVAYLKDKSEEILAVQDDATALVSVHRNVTSGQRFFKINGKVDGSTGDDQTTTELVAEIPFLVRDPSHPLKKVLTIGLGTGNTHGHVLKFNEVEKATVVELSPAVSQFARDYFNDFNGEFSANPKSELVPGDGRQFLAQSNDSQFDLIISEPSNPWVSGQSSLFTKEYYGLIAKKLAPQGLASLWFHSYGLGCEGVTSILKAIDQVFPRYLVFHEGGDYFVVASAQKSPLRAHDINAVSGLQKNWYGLFQTESLDGFLSNKLYFDDRSLKTALRNAVANTDDNQFLQYEAGRTFHREVQCTELEAYRTPEPTSFNEKTSAWNRRFQ